MKLSSILLQFVILVSFVGCQVENVPSDSISDTTEKATVYTISASSSEGGTVTGSGDVSYGETLEVVAISDAGYSFVNWTEGDAEVSLNTSYAFTVDGHRELVANFIPRVYTISVSSSEGGTVTVSGDVSYGETVEVVAVSDAGYSFVNWTVDDTEYSTGSSFRLRVEKDRVFVAVFVQDTEKLNGVFDGRMKSIFTIFDTDHVYTTIEVGGNDITITQDAFFGDECIFDGQIVNASQPYEASGTYKCSDFTNGTWSSTSIAKTSQDSFIAGLTIDNGISAYESNYNGFINESDIPHYYNSDRYFYNSGDYLDLNGTYDGDYKVDDSCFGNTFSVSPSDTEISIYNSDIEITTDSPFDGICIYTGIIDEISSTPLSAHGTVLCSNFNEGTWSSEWITLTGIDSFYAEIAVKIPDNSCSYTAQYSGFK
jgi:hypothetical protein